MNELYTIFGKDKNKQPTFNDLNEMKYLEMVIKESLRIFPAVPVYLRILEEQAEFSKSINISKLLFRLLECLFL